MYATVNVKQVKSLKDAVKRALPSSNNLTKKTIHAAIFDQLVALVDPGTLPWKPQKTGKSKVLLMVGLQVLLPFP